MSLNHPGRLFLEKHGQVETYEDVLAFAEFLRKEAGIGEQLPVDLSIITRHFGIEHRATPLPVQGLLLDAERGLILINADDIEHRQKFSLAHELIEYLFTELPQDKKWAEGWNLKRPGGFQEGTKEFLCNWAGANLLMPETYVQELITKHGVNFECAKALAKTCGVSLSAALIQLTRISERRHVVVLWCMKNKPKEISNKVSSSQLTMFSVESVLPLKKLRVEWSYGGKNSPYIPKGKSTQKSSLISSAWETGIFTSGKEKMTFDNRASRWYYSENMPQDCNDREKRVLSLLELLNG